MSDREKSIALQQPVRAKPLPLEYPGIHHIDQEEIDAAVNVLRDRSLWRYVGMHLRHEVESFEQEFRTFIGSRYALAVGSGTGALGTALSALGVGPGQEVIIPAYLWVSVVSAVVGQGAIPVLADIDETFCLNPADVERKIGPKTTGILMVHMSGAPGDIGGIRRVADQHGLWVLEDCAQCVGGSVGGRKVGTFGEMGIFSFQMNKNMTSGEGGCVVTDDETLYQRAVACHDMGFPRTADWQQLRFDDPSLFLWGKGTRLDELRAAVLRVQLRKLPRIIGNMRRSKYRVREALEAFPNVGLRAIQDTAGDTGPFLITTYPTAQIARHVNKRLIEEGIVSEPQGAFNIMMTDWGLHLYYNILSLVEKTSVDKAGSPWKLAENAGLEHDYHKGACPVADDLFERSILLPIPSCLTEKDEDDIVNAFGKVLTETFA